jgi:DNA-binding transcriptional LysR family regulator
MVPSAVLAEVLRSFQQMFPTVTLRLHVEGLGGVAALVLEERATLGVAGPDSGDLPALEGQQVGSVQMVPVAAPWHPLAQHEIAPGDVRKHLQLVLTDRTPLTEGKDFSVFSPRTWRLADLGSKHLLLREGIGWGSMPRHMIEGDVEQGRLVELRIPERPAIAYALNALWRRDTRLGPAAMWALDAFAERLAKVS